MNRYRESRVIIIAKLAGKWRTKIHLMSLIHLLLLFTRKHAFLYQRRIMKKSIVIVAREVYNNNIIWLSCFPLVVVPKLPIDFNTGQLVLWQNDDYEIINRL